MLARARTAPSSSAAAARSAPSCRAGDLAAPASDRTDGGASPPRASTAPRRAVTALKLTSAAPPRAHSCTASRRSAGSVTDPTGGPSKARGTPPLSPPAPVSSFAHALVRDAPCALADAARADKLGEERALHPLEKAKPSNEITEDSLYDSDGIEVETDDESEVSGDYYRNYMATLFGVVS